MLWNIITIEFLSPTLWTFVLSATCLLGGYEAAGEESSQLPGERVPDEQQLQADVHHVCRREWGPGEKPAVAH